METRFGRIASQNIETHLQKMNFLYHCHSNWSYDGKNSIAEYRQWAIERNITGMIFCEHSRNFNWNCLEQYLDECKTNSDKLFQVVPGIEYEWKEEHSIHIGCWGATTWLPVDFITIDQLETLKTNNPHIRFVLHHPRNIWYKIPQKLLGLMDYIEIWNIKNDFSYAPFYLNIRLWQKSGKKPIYGCDLHRIGDFYRIITVDRQLDTIEIASYPQSLKQLLAELHRLCYNALRGICRRLHIKGNVSLVKRLKGKK